MIFASGFQRVQYVVDLRYMTFVYGAVGQDIGKDLELPKFLQYAVTMSAVQAPIVNDTSPRMPIKQSTSTPRRHQSLRITTTENYHVSSR